MSRDGVERARNVTERILISAGILALGLCLSVGTGCDTSTKNKSKPVGTEENPAKAFDLQRPVTVVQIGAILMQQDQFFKSNEQGMKAAADQFGGTISIQNAGGALDKEISLVESFITQEMRAIVVSPLSSKASIKALKKAHDAGIKIITYNNSIEADFPVCTVSSDQKELGAATGRAARDYIEKKLKGKAKVALIGFASQLPEQGGARLEGFKQEVTMLPGVEIIAEQDAWLAPKAEEVVSELLAKKPDIIWAANEGATVGAVTAVKNAKKGKKVKVFGTDVSKQIIKMLQAKDGILLAVTGQRPREMGMQAMEAAIRAAKGKPIDAKKQIPGVLFTREEKAKLAQYLKSLE